MKKERKCIGCNITKESQEMIRITKDYKTGELIINPDKYHFGRSVYVCKDENCINNVLKKDRLSRFLKKNLTENEKENIKTVLNRMIVVQH